MSKNTEVMEVEGKKYRIIEQPVDIASGCVKRTLVPADMDEDDVPLGARLLDERETEGHLARASRPDDLNVGDPVMRKFPQGYVPTADEASSGTIEARVKGGRFKVRFANGAVEKLGPDDLARIW